MKKISMDDGQMVVFYREVRSAYKTAAKFGISANTVYRKLEQHGVERDGVRGVDRKLPPTVADEYHAGASMNQIARKYGACLPTVAEALDRAGAVSRRRGGRTAELTQNEIERILKLYSDLRSQEKVARIVCRSQPVISRILCANGVSGKRKGEKHGSWKGGRTIQGEGYIYVWIDPSDPMRVMAQTQGYVAEHRLTIARLLGRPLDRHETVHHINGDKTDNRLENLQLRTGKHGKGVVHRCRDCGSTNIESTRLH